MAKWIKYCAKYSASKIVRYEDYSKCDPEFFQNIVNFLYPDETLASECEETIHSMFTDFVEQRAPLMHRYPRGYSGSVGIWKNYFSKQNVETYNRIVRGFLDFYPGGAELNGYYSDLIISE